MYNFLMAGLIYDARKIMVYEDLKYLAEFSGKPADFADTLWAEFLNKAELYEEFLYYIDHKSLKDKFEFRGYFLSDIYVYLLGEYKMFKDIGKNGSECSKEWLILETFMEMAHFINDPDNYIKKLEAGRGMDIM